MNYSLRFCHLFLVFLLPVFGGGAVGCSSEAPVESSVDESIDEDEPESISLAALRAPPSPPYVNDIHACGETVLVGGVHENAVARLFVDGDQVGEAGGTTTGLVHFSVPPLEEGAALNATQKVNGVESGLSATRIVHSLYEPLARPTIPYDIWECGQKVTAQAQVPGTMMRLFVDGKNAYRGFTTDRWRNDKWPMELAEGLPQAAEATADIVYCPGTEDEQTSQMSEISVAKDSPSVVEIGNVTAYEESNRLRIEDTYVGAFHQKHKNNEHVLNNRAKFDDYYHRNFSDIVVGQDDKFDVNAELCEGTAGRPVRAEIVEKETTLSLLNFLRIEGPVCPDTDVIRVETALHAGALYIFVNGEAVQAQPVSGRPTVIDVNGLSLNEGDELGVQQVLEGEQWHEGPLTTVEVGADTTGELRVHGAREYVDQLTGLDINAFVRDGDEKSAGPEFTYTCCTECECSGCQDAGYQCLEDGEVREIELRVWNEIIGEEDDFTTEVTLYEESRGHFRGRWNWTELDTPPPGGHQYVARILDSPCIDEGDTPHETFKVAIGEGDLEADEGPTRAMLIISDSTGAMGAVSDEMGDSSVIVSTSSSFDVQATGLDQFSGVKKVEVIGEGDINLSMDTKTADNSTPVPFGLGFEAIHGRLKPGEELTLRTRVYDWSMNVLESHSLHIEGGAPEHEEPVITSISPAYPNTDGEITINGEHLLYDSPDFETKVFIRSGGIQEVVPESEFGSNSTHSKLKDVPIPEAFANFGGESAEVRVQTIYNESDAKNSNWKEFVFFQDCTHGTSYKTLENVSSANTLPNYQTEFFRPFQACWGKRVYVNRITNPENDWGTLNNGCSLYVDAFQPYSEGGGVGGTYWAETGDLLPGQSETLVFPVDQSKEWWWIATVFDCGSGGQPENITLEFDWHTGN